VLYLLAKALISGAIVAVASEVAKRSPAFAALIVSLPLVSILAMMWLWNDTGDTQQVTGLAFGTFWFVLPSLPMFLVLAAMLRYGVPFLAGAPQRVCTDGHSLLCNGLAARPVRYHALREVAPQPWTGARRAWTVRDGVAMTPGGESTAP